MAKLTRPRLQDARRAARSTSRACASSASGALAGVVLAGIALRVRRRGRIAQPPRTPCGRSPRRAAPRRPMPTAAAGRQPAESATTSTRCCRISRWWCRRRTSDVKRDLPAAARRAARRVRAAGRLVPQRGGRRARARAAGEAGRRCQGAARRGGQRCLAPRAHRADQRSRRAEQACASSCRRRTSTRW